MIKNVKDLELKKGSLVGTFSHLPDKILNGLDIPHDNALLIWDENDRICYSSSSMKRLFGYEPKELIDNLWTNYIEPTSSVTVKNYFKKDFSEPHIFYLELIDKKRKLISIVCQLSKRRDDETNEEYNICLMRHLTNRASSEEEMVFSEKMAVLGQLTAGVAHEIRNPLTSIKGFIQLLQAGVNHKEEYYKIMLDEVDKMETITTELLNLAKPLTEERKLERLDEMINDVIVLLQTQATLKKIEIKTNLAEGLTLYCNRSQIKQILINLVKNAIEAMEEPGVICISTYCKHGKLFIKIQDEGIGFPPELIKRLGEPFVTTKANGTGLGLMIIKQILDQYDGTLSILNNKDKGSTFSIQFSGKCNERSEL